MSAADVTSATGGDVCAPWGPYTPRKTSADRGAGSPSSFLSAAAMAPPHPCGRRCRRGIAAAGRRWWRQSGGRRVRRTPRRRQPALGELVGKRRGSASLLPAPVGAGALDHPDDAVAQSPLTRVRLDLDQVGDQVGQGGLDLIDHLKPASRPRPRHRTAGTRLGAGRRTESRAAKPSRPSREGLGGRHRLGDGLLELGAHVGEQLAEQLALGSEVLVEDRLGDPGRLGDVVHRGVVKAPFREDPECDLDELAAPVSGGEAGGHDDGDPSSGLPNGNSRPSPPRVGAPREEGRDRGRRGPPPGRISDDDRRRQDKEPATSAATTAVTMPDERPTTKPTTNRTIATPKNAYPARWPRSAQRASRRRRTITGSLRSVTARRSICACSSRPCHPAQPTAGSIGEGCQVLEADAAVLHDAEQA